MNRRILQGALGIVAILTSICSYVIILMGAIVTNTGSGTGCGTSWPICQGQLVPDTMTRAAFIEYSHRVVSGLDGFFIFILALCAWLMYHRDFRVKLFACMSVFFVVLQGGLGALTVVYENTFAQSYLLALHFGFSLIAFASVVLLTVRLFQLAKEERGQQRAPARTGSKGLRYAIWGITVYCYIVVYTGAFVHHANAITGCGFQYPLCGSTFLPNLTTPAGIQVLHRLAAGAIGVLVVLFMLWILRSYRERRDLVISSILALLLVVLQGVVGAMIVTSGGQLMVSLLHATVVTGFFSVLCYLCMQIGWPWQKHVLEREQVLSHHIKEGNVLSRS
ncbi:MAG TPA: COX15/CtaA family protein [Dictyobacter sp.]|nr:COX15/CtaA family protein [Dictyobacter sp.]